MKLGLITALAIALWPYYAIADTRPDNGTPTNPGPSTGTPNGPRTPGGTRGGACKQMDKPITALVPETVEGSTTAEYPVFWFYIPDVPDDVDSIEFSLHPNDEKTTLYRTSVQLAEAPGVISIPLPSSSNYALKLNENYHWRLIVTCVQSEAPEVAKIILDGWVTRVEPSSNLENQSDVIWYDELTNLAKRYLLEPENPEVKQAWTELLRSVGLERLATEPLVNSVSNPAK